MTDHGSYLGKEKEQFKISFGMSDKPTRFVPAIKVEGILIDAKVTISSGAFQLLRKFGIFAIWHSNYKDDGMLLQPFVSHGSVEVRRSQYAAIDDQRAIVIAAKIVYSACQNKLTVLRRIQRRYNEIKINDDIISQMTSNISDFISSDKTHDILDLDLRQELMNTEAIITKQYYKGIQQFLHMYHWEFPHRSRRPASEPYNALLNYSYAILKGQLTHAISVCGLDIYAGFLHTDRSGRSSLILDIIEEFRQIVDEVLLNLISTGKVTQDMFSNDEGQVEIDQECKEVLIPALFTKFKQRIRGKSIHAWMIYQGQQLANYLRGISQEYQPFLLQVGDPF